MVSPTRWTWISVHSGSWWWTGRPGEWKCTPVFLPGESQGRWSPVGCPMGLHRVGHDWSNLARSQTQLMNWTEPNWMVFLLFLFLVLFLSILLLLILSYTYTIMCWLPLSACCEFRLFFLPLKKALASSQDWRAFFLYKLKYIWVLPVLYLMTCYIVFSFWITSEYILISPVSYSLPHSGLQNCCLIFYIMHFLKCPPIFNFNLYGLGAREHIWYDLHY